MLGFESNWQKNVTVDTRKLNIQVHGAVQRQRHDDYRLVVLHSAPGIKIHNNGLPDEGEI